MQEQLLLELAKGGITLVVTLVGLGVASYFGKRLTYHWNLRQKRRESELETAHDLQRLYGDFFSVWKVWNGESREPSPLARHELLRRAAEVEGLLERVLVKLATERRLNSSDREMLGKFRQGCQQLRNAINEDKDLDWTESEQAKYLAFKRLAIKVTLIVQREEENVTPIGAEEAFESLRDITSNRHEKSWST